MRQAVALVVAFVLGSCALDQSRSERAFVRGEGPRATQAAWDANVIMEGMARARDNPQRFARDTMPNGAGASSPESLSR